MKHRNVINLSLLAVLTVASAGRAAAQSTWNLNGNSVAPGQFLGSTNFEAVDFRVGNMRLLRLEPDPRTNLSHFSGNIIGGFAGNAVEQPNAGGNFIGAGGFPAGPNIVRSNSHGVFIGGGSAHQIGPNVNDAVIVGGFGNVLRGFNSFIGAGNNNTIDAARSAINAGSFNQVASGANRSMIGGGFANSMLGFNSFIGSGEGNSVAAHQASISAGYGNAINAGSFYSSISAGFSNRIVGTHAAFIGGGIHNAVHTNAYYSIIGAGAGNFVGTNSDLTVIGGGSANRSESDARVGVIGGGFFNTIRSGAFASTIGGGAQNTNAGQYSTIAGGFFNGSINDFSTVGGGEQNSGSGVWSTVPGGFQNRAVGEASFAAGALASANHDGSFVWAGGATLPYPSIRTNTFNAYGAAGMTFEYGGQSGGRAGLGRGNRSVVIGLNAGSTISAWNGARLTDSGVWANASDKHRKTGFKEIDPQDVLDRLAALPVREWRYTNETSHVKHLGPTAQDFQAAFGFGNDDKSIGTVDADGVALAAIQGLNRKLREELKRRDADNAALKQSVEELKSLVNTLMRKQGVAEP